MRFTRARHSARRSGVAREHLEPREHVVAEGDRLRGLEVGEAGEHGVGLALGDGEDHVLQRTDRLRDVVERLAQAEPHRGGDLVVARSPGVQALAGVADPLGEHRLDVHVHVLERRSPLEATRLDVGEDVLEPGDDGVAIRFAQHPDLGEHGRVGDGAPDVVAGKPAIEAHRLGEPLDQCVGRLGEPARPELGGWVSVAHWKVSESGDRGSGIGVHAGPIQAAISPAAPSWLRRT